MDRPDRRVSIRARTSPEVGCESHVVFDSPPCAALQDTDLLHSLVHPAEDFHDALVELTGPIHDASEKVWSGFPGAPVKLIRLIQ